jgi:hypothetical protein
MYKIVIILFLFLLQQKELSYHSGKPTSKGVDEYIKTNESAFVKEYQIFVKDTLYNYYIHTQNFTEFADYDSIELGRFYIPDEIIITNETKYKDYSIDHFSKFKRKFLNENDQFVKAVVMHELTHDYFYQIILEMRMQNKYISPEYNNIILLPNNENSYGTNFIEEGVCEYVPIKMGEKLLYDNVEIPDNISQLLDNTNIFKFKYKYSSEYVKNYLDSTTIKYGTLKSGIQILLSNKPPTYKEIMNPNLYFNRLK